MDSDQSGTSFRVHVTFFRVDEHGEVAEVHFNNQMRSWYYDVPVESLHSVYEALKIFDDYARMPENMLELKMLPGKIGIRKNCPSPRM